MSHDDSKRKLAVQDRLLLKDMVEERNCAALGHVLTAFQRLEHQLKGVTGYFVDQSDYKLGIIVTSEISFRALLNLVYSLAQHRGVEKKRIESLQEILKDCFAAEQRRNTFVHSYWEPEPESLRTTRFKYTAKYPAGYKHQIEDVTEADLLKFTKEIYELSLDISELMDAHDSNWTKATTFPELFDVTSSLLPKDLQEAIIDGDKKA